MLLYPIVDIEHYFSICIYFIKLYLISENNISEILNTFNMLNKKENPEALLELTEDELAHIEYCFLMDFTAVLEKHQYFYENHSIYKNLVEFYKFAKNQLKWNEEFTA